MQSTKYFVYSSLVIIFMLFALLVSQASARYDEQFNDAEPEIADDDTTDLTTNTLDIVATANESWPQVQGDANRSGYVSQSVGPPYTELWRIGQYDDPNDRMPPISSRVQPIIAENLIFMPSNDNHLYAFSTTDGQTVWRFATTAPLVNSAAYEGGKVFVGSTDKDVYAINANDGSLAWKYSTNGSIRSAPLLADGKVFIGSSDGNMYALNQTNGALVWSYNINAPIYDTAAYDNGKIFFGGMDSVGYGIDAQTGNLLWDIAIPGQGFRDRWTVAGNGKVIFTPMLAGNHHQPLAAGTFMFHANPDNSPVIYNKSWSVQKQEILDYLATNPYHQPIFIIDQNTGQESFTPPILFASGGSMSPHSQPVLLPNGNANVIYRRSFGEAAEFGQTTDDAIYLGELNLATGDIAPIDICKEGGGEWIDCGDFKSPFTLDESAALFRSGNIIYLDIARGTVAMDTVNEVRSRVTVYNNTSNYFGGPDAIEFYPDHDEWILTEDYSNLLSEVASDGNDLKRPSPLVDNVFYVFHYNTLVAIKGTIQ